MPTEIRIKPSVIPIRSRVSFGTPGMRGARRMRNQALGAAETDGELDDLQSVEQAKRLRLSALDAETERRSRALALALEHRLPRIVGVRESRDN